MTLNSTGRTKKPSASGLVLYFAYGSNLDVAQLSGRCAGARVVVAAQLQNHALAFGGFSRTWGGPVASVRPSRGVRVEGVLYEMPARELLTLDRYEGHPHAYQRRQRYVVDAQGRRYLAAVYAQPSRDFDPGPPRHGYLALIATAYQRLGFDLAALSAASRNELPVSPNEPVATTLVFTYGTLLEGERNHRLLRTARLVGAASTPPKYELRHLGGYPGMVRGGTRAIAGEIYEVDAATLSTLDRLEGHPTFYRRTRIRLADGVAVSAYLLRRQQVERCPIITTNDWRTSTVDTRA